MSRQSAPSWKIRVWPSRYRKTGGGWWSRTTVGRKPRRGWNRSTTNCCSGERNRETMRIGIDAHFASYELRGIGKYVVQLVSGLMMADGTHEYVIYGDPRMFPQPNGRGNVKFRNPGSLPYPVWEQAVLPRWVRQDGVELLHCPSNTAPVALAKQVKLIITVHDVMYLLPGSVLTPSKVFRQRFGNFYRRLVVPRVAGRADRIIAVSKFSKREITEHLRIVPNRIHAIHEGVDEQFARLAGAITSPPKEMGGERLDGPFILEIGRA